MYVFYRSYLVVLGGLAPLADELLVLLHLILFQADAEQVVPKLAVVALDPFDLKGRSQLEKSY